MNRLSKFIHPDLINGNIFTSLLIFTLPLLISFIFQQLYNAVDTVIVGHYLGEESLAAIGASAALYELLVGFGMGFGNGLSIVAARAYGADDKKLLKKIVASSLIITLAVTVFIMALTHFYLYKILVLLGTPDSICDESFAYISIITLYSGVLFAYNLFSALLRATGNTFIPLLFLIVSSVLNIILDVFFITVCGMGVKGAAWATVIAQGVSGALTLLYILKCTKILIPDSKSFKIVKRIYRDLLGQGLSMACMGSIVASGTVILQSAINGLGTLVIAGHISARKLFSISNIPIITLGMASSTFVSQNLGAGKIDRIKKGVLISIAVTVVWAAFVNLLMPFTARSFIRWISGSDNSVVLDYGSKYLIFSVPFYLVLGALIVIRNSLQGLGSKVLPLVSSVIELLGKILFTAFIIPVLGIWGVILCEPLIWCVMTAQLAFVYFRHPVFTEYKKKTI